jgi:hypothetical protein
MPAPNGQIALYRACQDIANKNPEFFGFKNFVGIIGSWRFYLSVPELPILTRTGGTGGLIAAQGHP